MKMLELKYVTINYRIVEHPVEMILMGKTICSRRYKVLHNPKTQDYSKIQDVCAQI